MKQWLTGFPFKEMEIHFLKSKGLWWRNVFTSNCNSTLTEEKELRSNIKSERFCVLSDCADSIMEPKGCGFEIKAFTKANLKGYKLFVVSSSSEASFLNPLNTKYKLSCFRTILSILSASLLGTIILRSILALHQWWDYVMLVPLTHLTPDSL